MPSKKLMGYKDILKKNNKVQKRTQYLQMKTLIEILCNRILEARVNYATIYLQSNQLNKRLSQYLNAISKTMDRKVSNAVILLSSTEMIRKQNKKAKPIYRN